MAGSELRGEDRRMTVRKRPTVSFCCRQQPRDKGGLEDSWAGKKCWAERAALLGPAMPEGASSSCFNPVGLDVSATNSENNRFI